MNANFDRDIDMTIFLHSRYEVVIIGGDDCEIRAATSTQRIALHARAGILMNHHG